MGIKKLYGKGWRVKTVYDCICDCWNKIEIAQSKLRKYSTCGCWVSKELSIKELNERYMKDCGLEIVCRTDIVPDNAETSNMFLCNCLCGSYKLVRKSKLLKSKTCWCGIGRREINCSPRYAYSVDSEKRNPTKWRSHLRLIYQWMFKRCYDTSNISYKNYWWRGIRVEQEWFNYEKFIEDMGHIPAWMTLDRIDNNKNYCKENCRWATDNEQARNKRNNVVYEGIIMKDWADVMGIGYRWLKRKLQWYENKNEKLWEIVETWRLNIENQKKSEELF